MRESGFTLLCVSSRVLRLSSSSCHELKFLPQSEGVLLSSNGLGCPTLMDRLSSLAASIVITAAESKIEENSRKVAIVIKRNAKGSEGTQRGSRIGSLRRGAWRCGPTIRKTEKGACILLRERAFLVCNIL